jgi:hypothetical protein
MSLLVTDDTPQGSFALTLTYSNQNENVQALKGIEIINSMGKDQLLNSKKVGLLHLRLCQLEIN